MATAYCSLSPISHSALVPTANPLLAFNPKQILLCRNILPEIGLLHFTQMNRNWNFRWNRNGLKKWDASSSPTKLFDFESIVAHADEMTAFNFLLYGILLIVEYVQRRRFWVRSYLLQICGRSPVTKLSVSLWPAGHFCDNCWWS